MQRRKVLRTCCLGLAPFALLVALLILIRGVGSPVASTEAWRPVVRRTIQGREKLLAAARREYDPKRWDRVYAVARHLCFVREWRTVEQTDGERSWSPPWEDAEGEELVELLERAEKLARTPEERAATELLQMHVMKPPHNLWE